MRAVERTFSDFLRQPNEVVDELGEHDVVLRRRDGPSLHLTQADRAQERIEAFEVLARLLRSVTLRNATAIESVVGETFQWAHFLPERDRAEFVRDLTLTLVASSDIDNFAPVVQVLHEWRATAEIHADPKLARRLREPVDAAGGRVAPPED